MDWFLAALAILVLSGLVSLTAGNNQRLACALGTVGSLLGGGIVLVQAARVLVTGESISMRLAWELPLGSANMAIDPLSAVFALSIALVTMAAAVYGCGYLPTSQGVKRLGSSWFFYNMLTASMLTVVAARNGLLFLLSWELMSLASFFLVLTDAEKPAVRRAGWIYLVAMHLGTAFLFAMFLLLGQPENSLDFERLSSSDSARDLLFLMALIGFGTKAGFMPMHVWLPEAHPAAPSHVSAVMSGVMIKTGIYGLLRILMILGEPPTWWWGWTLLIIGVVSGVLGVLYALAQHNMKRLLAYSSVENIGIIAMAIGVGLLGLSHDNPVMAALSFTGALLHVLNHSVFKSLLFLGAGSVLHAAGTGEIDRLGGLMKRMPTTGATFLIGAAAISGLPPLNGFVSEFLIYLGVMAGIGGPSQDVQAWGLMCVIVVGGLALIGGLAAACFTKVFGIAFLGEPRSPQADHAHEAGAAMRWPMFLLASLCMVIGFSAPFWPMLLETAVASIVPNALTDIAREGVRQAVAPMMGITLGSCLLLGFVLVLMHIRRKLLMGRRVERSITWDCGYIAPSPRMQYTASSFSRPIVQLFRLFLQPRDEIHEPRGLFPLQADLHTETPDLFRRFVFEPIFAGVAWAASKLRWLQEGHIQLYVLYIAITLLVLLIWKLG